MATEMAIFYFILASIKIIDTVAWKKACIGTQTVEYNIQQIIQICNIYICNIFIFHKFLLILFPFVKTFWRMNNDCIIIAQKCAHCVYSIYSKYTHILSTYNLSTALTQRSVSVVFLSSLFLSAFGKRSTSQLPSSAMRFLRFSPLYLSHKSPVCCWARL